MRERIKKKKRETKIIHISDIKQAEKIKTNPEITTVAVLPSGNGIIIPNESNNKIRKTKYSLF